MTATTPTLTTQLQTLRTNTAHMLDDWREVLAAFRERGDSNGIALSTMSSWRVQMLLIDIDELLGEVTS